MKMEPHPEHQQNNAQLRELLHRVGIRHKSRRIRPYHYPGQQVPDQWRQMQFSGNKAEKEGGGQSADKSEDEAEIVIHTRVTSLRGYL